MSGTDVAAVVARFGSHEFAIRRLHASNPEFRAVCEDFATAMRALDKWQADLAKAREYRVLVAELEWELLEFLEPRESRIAERSGR